MKNQRKIDEMDDRYNNLKYEFVKYQPSTVTFYNHDRYILLQEPSLLAVNTETGQRMAAGKEAQKVSGIAKVVVGSPLKNGVVADFWLAKEMFQLFLKEAIGRKQFFKPNIAVCSPKDMTAVERQALSELIYSIGGKNNSALIIMEPFEKAISVIPEPYKIIIEISPAI